MSRYGFPRAYRDLGYRDLGKDSFGNHTSREKHQLESRTFFVTVAFMRNCFTNLKLCKDLQAMIFMESMVDEWVVVNGLKIRYWSNQKLRGLNSKKQTIVFFHGYSFSLDDWKRIGTLDLMSRLGHMVYAIDLPSGKATMTDKMKGNKKSAFIPVIEKIFEALGLRSPKSDPNMVLVGPSMGGGFALSYALSHPRELAALVLISPSTKSMEDEDTSNLKIPVLLLWGDRDNVFPVDEFGQRLKTKLKNSKLIIIKNAGHAAYLDKPDEFHEILTDFLDELASG